MPARVSVLIAAFNAGAIIARAIGSVQAQTFADWEIIIVDDASTDDTVDVVTALAAADPRIRLIRHETNQGPAAARNSALAAALGKWVAILDADDAWRPERLEKMLAFADRTGSDLVADNQIIFDEGSQREVRTALELPGESTAITLERLLASEYEDTPLRLGLLKPIIRRQFIVEHGLGYSPRLRYAEDLHFYARLLINGIRAELLSEPYYIYTAPVGPLSRQRSQFSRTATAVESRLWISDDLMDTYRQRLTAREIAEISAYRKRAQKRLAVNRITSLRGNGRFVDLALFAISHPAATIRYVMKSRTFKGLMGRSSQ